MDTGIPRELIVVTECRALLDELDAGEKGRAIRYLVDVYLGTGEIVLDRGPIPTPYVLPSS